MRGVARDVIAVADQPTSSRAFSFEFFPPRNDVGHKRFGAALRDLAALGPSFVSVTFGAGGSTRDGSFRTVSEILRSTRLEVAPHLSCIGSTVEQVRAQLDAYRPLGVKRIVAIRGDAPEGQGELPMAFPHADGLVAYIKSLGGFRVSVACYPEFHPQAVSPLADVENFVRKVDMGADEGITQYFYANAAYERFVEWARRLGVRVPIVPGLMPLTNYEQVARFSKFCGAEIPAWIRKRMEQYADDPDAQAELGIELGTRQAEELLRNGAPGLHFYTLNRAEPTVRIWKNLGLPTASAD